MKKTIFINGRFLTQQVTGVQRYSRELLRSMDALLETENAPQDVGFICLAPPEPFQHPGWKQIEIRRVGINKGNLWEQADLAFHAHGQLLFSPANIGPFYYRNQVVTMHDASTFAVSGAYSRSFRAKYAFIFKQLVKNARRMITDSHFSQQELSHYLRTSPTQFTVMPLGADHLDRIQSDSRILDEYRLRQHPYLLMVANQSAHKNLQNVFEALKQIKTEVQWVVAGGSFKQIFQTTEKQSIPANVQRVHYVSDEQLKALYENALGFIFPSIYEGFGLPILEAMRCACPVLCSNAASIPEVAGQAALYFDPCQPEEIARVLHHFIANPQIHTPLKVRGLEQASQFLWHTTAKKLMQILFEISTS